MLLVPVEPHVLGNIGQVAALRLLHRFAEWLIAHSLELGALWAVLQSPGRRRVQQGRHVVDRSVW